MSPVRGRTTHGVVIRDPFVSGRWHLPAPCILPGAHPRLPTPREGITVTHHLCSRCWVMPSVPAGWAHGEAAWSGLESAKDLPQGKEHPKAQPGGEGER